MASTTTTERVSVQNTEARNEFVEELMELMEVIDELVIEKHINENANIKLKNKTKQLYDRIENKFNMVKTNVYYHTLRNVVRRNTNNTCSLNYSQKTTKGGYTPCNKCGRLIKDGGKYSGRGHNKIFTSFMEQHQKRAVCVNILGQKEGVHKTCGGAEDLTKNEVLTHRNNHIHTIATEGMLIHKKRQKEKLKLWKYEKKSDDYIPEWVKDPDGNWMSIDDAVLQIEEVYESDDE